MLTTAQMRIPCIFKIAILVALLFTVQTYAQTSKERPTPPQRRTPVPRIDGYGSYKFGMSIEQAKEARPTAKRTDCNYVGTAYCLTESTKFFGQDARIDALFDKGTKRLSSINITFDRIGGKEKACKKVLEAIATPLLQKWGIPTREEGATLYWESVYGGTLALVRLCIDDDSGVVVVSYEDTSGF